MDSNTLNNPIFNRNFGSHFASGKTYNPLRLLEKDYLTGKNTYLGHSSPLQIESTTRAAMPRPFLIRGRMVKLMETWSKLFATGVFQSYPHTAAQSAFTSLGGVFTFPHTDWLYRPIIHATYTNAANVLNFTKESLIQRLAIFLRGSLEGIKSAKFNQATSSLFRVGVGTVNYTNYKPIEQVLVAGYNPREPYFIKVLQEMFQIILETLNQDTIDTLQIDSPDFGIDGIQKYSSDLLNFEQMFPPELIASFKVDDYNSILFYDEILPNYSEEDIQLYNTWKEYEQERIRLQAIYDSIQDWLLYIVNNAKSTTMDIFKDGVVFGERPTADLPVSTVSSVIKKIKIGVIPGTPAVPAVIEKYMETEIHPNPDFISIEETPEVPETIEVQVEKERIITEEIPEVPERKIYKYLPCTRIKSNSPIIFNKQVINWYNFNDRPFIMFFQGASAVNTAIEKYPVIYTDKSKLFTLQFAPSQTMVSIGLSDFNVQEYNKEDLLEEISLLEDTLRTYKVVTNDDKEYRNSLVAEREAKLRILYLMKLQETKYDIVLDNTKDNRLSKEPEDFEQFQLTYIDTLDVFIKLVP